MYIILRRNKNVGIWRTISLQCPQDPTEHSTLLATLNCENCPIEHVIIQVPD